MRWNQKVRYRSLIALLTVLAMIVAACGDGDDTGTEDTAADDPATTTEAPAEMVEVTFAPTAPLPIYWPYFYIAEPLGFYEDEGIDIEFVNVQTAVQQSLLAGRLTFAGTGLDYILQAPTLDGEIPKWFLNVDKYLWVMVTLADSDVMTASDLRGGVIGINAPHDSVDADFLMGAAGVAQGEYELVPVGEDRAALVALQEGEIDAFVTAGAVSVEALRDFTDQELRVIENEEAESYYNIGAMLTAPQLENDRDLAVRFGRAVARGMVWTWENPQATAELIYEMFPESAESAEQAVRLIEAGNEANRASYEARGAMELDIYQAMVDKHVEVGLLEESYDASALFTNDLIDDIWDFDVDAEIERARNDER